MVGWGCESQIVRIRPVREDREETYAVGELYPDNYFREILKLR